MYVIEQFVSERIFVAWLKIPDRACARIIMPSEPTMGIPEAAQNEGENEQKKERNVGNRYGMSWTDVFKPRIPARYPIPTLPTSIPDRSTGLLAQVLVTARRILFHPALPE